MINDVTYELIRISKKLDSEIDYVEPDVKKMIDDMEAFAYLSERHENLVKTTYESIEKIIKEMVETDNQFRFKKGIFDRQYGMNVKYVSCGEIAIKVKDGRDLVTIMDVDDFLSILSFRIYKGIEKAKEEYKSWKLWKLNKEKLEKMGVM